MFCAYYGVAEVLPVGRLNHEAQKRQEVLKHELIQIEMIQYNNSISIETVYKMLEAKKNLLFSSNDNEKKQVLQEYVDCILLNHQRILTILTLKLRTWFFMFTAILYI